MCTPEVHRPCHTRDQAGRVLKAVFKNGIVDGLFQNEGVRRKSLERLLMIGKTLLPGGARPCEQLREES
jgi:hypothetical protein